MNELQLIMVIFGVALLAVAGLVRGLPVGYCANCAHCKYEAAEKLRKQRELRHDFEHKGQGFTRESLDRMSCRDEGCPRNPKPPIGPS